MIHLARLWRMNRGSSLPNISANITSIVNIAIDVARNHRIERFAIGSLCAIFSCTIEIKSFLYLMPAQPPRRLRFAVQTSVKFRKAVLRSTQGRLYLHSALYRSRKIYLSAHLFSIDERSRVSEMKSGENFSREQNRARK